MSEWIHPNRKETNILAEAPDCAAVCATPRQMIQVCMCVCARAYVCARGRGLTVSVIPSLTFGIGVTRTGAELHAPGRKALRALRWRRLHMVGKDSMPCRCDVWRDGKDGKDSKGGTDTAENELVCSSNSRL